jgi:hypothetical protein
MSISKRPKLFLLGILAIGIYLEFGAYSILLLDREGLHQSTLRGYHL